MASASRRKSTSQINSTAASAAVSAAFSGTSGNSVAIGLGVALNDITGTIAAKINGSDINSSGVVDVEAKNTSTINATGAAAAIAIGAGANSGLAIGGGGAAAYNYIDVDVEASATDSSIDATGDISVKATGDSEIKALILAAAATLSFGGNSGVGASIGAAVAINRIGGWTLEEEEENGQMLPTGDATLATDGASGVRAFLKNTSVEGSGGFSVAASSEGLIDARVAAGSFAIGGGGTTGGGVAVAGVYTMNVIAVATQAYVDNTPASDTETKDIAADAISVTASDTSDIDVVAGAAAVAGGFGGTTGVAVSIGFAMAQNTIANNVAAYLETIDTVRARDGNLALSATSDASINATAATASLSVAIGGTTGISFSGGGAIALNDISTDTNAYIDNSTVFEADAITVSADAKSSIEAKIVSVSLSIGVGGSVGGAASFGVAVAENQIGNGASDRDQVQAYIRSSTITTDGTLTLAATSEQDIDAIVLAGSAAIGGGSVGVGLSGAGAGSGNTIAVKTAAFIDGSAKTITAGAIDIDAWDKSTIDATNAAASLAAGFGATGLAGSVAVAIARNKIDNDVLASVTGGQTLITTTGDIAIDARREGSIHATSAAASLGLAISAGSAAVALSGAGASATNEIYGDTIASVSGGMLDSAAGVRVAAKMDSTIDATVAALVAAIAIDPVGGGIGAAIGASVATNTIGNGVADRNKVEASLTDTKVDAIGQLQLEALTDNTINSLVAAAAAALSGGGVGVAATGAGASTENRIAVATKATIDGDGTGDDEGIFAGSVDMLAKDHSSITSEAYAGAVAAAIGGVAGGAAIGVGIAQNTIENTIAAEVKNVDEKLDARVGGISIRAIDDATIKTKAGAASLAVSLGGTGISLSGAGASAKNIIDVDTVASVEQQRARQQWRCDRHRRKHRAHRLREIAAIAVSAAIGAGAGVGVAIGASVAINQIGDWSVGSNPTNDPMHAADAGRRRRQQGSGAD